MPTAAHLISAAVFAALAWIASEMAKPLMPDGTKFGLFSEMNAALGGWLAWKIMGPRAKTGLRASVSAGLTTAVTLFLAAAAMHSFLIMLKRSIDDRYADPLDALTSAIAMMWEFGEPAMTPEILGLLLAGGLLGGVLAAAAARTWS